MTDPAREIELQLRAMEHEEDFFDFRIDGWCVWPRLRFWVAVVLQQLTFTERVEMGLVRRLGFAARDLPVLLAPGPARLFVKTRSVVLTEQVGARYKDVIFDDLLLRHDSYFKVESIHSRSFLPRSRAALVRRNSTSGIYDLAPSVLSRLRKPRYVLDMAEELAERLRRRTGRSEFSARVVSLHLLNFYWMKRLYARLLEGVRPTYVLVADPDEYALVAAARELGIVTVEFQHGFLDRDHHPSYDWPAAAAAYKKAMPVPDRLFLFGEYWRQELEANGFWGDSLRAVGSPRMDQYRRKRSETAKSSGCLVVMTTQGLDLPAVISFITEFLNLAAGRVEFRLVFKLHPHYDIDKSPYVSAFAAYPNVQVLLGNESPSTFELLAGAQLHVSISSTCHYDAIGLGVPTVILPLATHENVQRLCNDGDALFAATPRDLLSIVEHVREIPVRPGRGGWYYTPGAISNIERELELA